MAKKRLIQLEDLYPRGAHYARAVRVDDTIYVSGTIGRNEQGEFVGVDDVERQTDQTFQNLRRVLQAAGATFDDVVKVNTYALSPDHRQLINAVRDRYLKEHSYTSTFIVPKALAYPELLVEIEVVAVLSNQGGRRRGKGSRK